MWFAHSHPCEYILNVLALIPLYLSLSSHRVCPLAAAAAPLQAAPNLPQAAGVLSVSAPDGGYNRASSGQLPPVKYRDYGFQFRSKLRGTATREAARRSTSGPADVTSADALHLHCVSQCEKNKNKDACVKLCHDLRRLK